MSHTYAHGAVRAGVAAAVAALALGLGATVAPAPARALEVVADSSLPGSIDSSVPDDATLISQDYARLSTGEVVSVSDGSRVSDADVLGTAATPPDPLGASDGERFEQLSVGEARAELSEGGASLLAQRLGGNEYGAHWGTYRDEPAFYMADGTMFVCQAEGIVDVSEWNYDIDWEAAVADGVQGAIIRIGFGTTRLDYYAEKNIEECKRLGIPFGVYIYSYAEEPGDGAAEGQQVVAWLRELGVEPGDLSLPVFYDLEHWTWTGHTPPTDPAVYEGIVRAWMAEVEAAGYTDAGVYSYTNYLYGPLDSDYIHERTLWAAQYGSSLAFTDFSSNFRGWQYTSSGAVDGFPGRVDLNAFGNAAWAGDDEGDAGLNGGSDGAGGDATPDEGEDDENDGAAGDDGEGGDAADEPHTPENCPSAGFEDVAYDAWYHDGVDWAITNGVFGGYGDGGAEFGPIKEITRAEMAQALWNQAGRPASDADLSGFSDVDASGWYAEAISWCLEQGYFTGYGTTFGTERQISREEAATVLWRLSGMPASAGDLSSFSDASAVSEYATDAMAWAVGAGVITGKGGVSLDPQGTCTRGEVATMLMRMSS